MDIDRWIGYDLLSEEYRRLWLPNDIEFVVFGATSTTGTFSKKDLRDRYTDVENARS